MPKFLDVPSWYSRAGNYVESVDIQYQKININTQETDVNLVLDNKPDGKYGWELVGTLEEWAGNAPSVRLTYAGTTLFFTQETTIEYNSYRYRIWVEFYPISGTVIIHNCYLYNASGSTENPNVFAVEQIGTTVVCKWNADQGLVSFRHILDLRINSNANLPVLKPPSTLYAPTSGGAFGQILASNGNGSAPSWVNFTVNGQKVGQTSMAENIYAPISAGTFGQIVTVDSSGMPMWKKYYLHTTTIRFGSGDSVESLWITIPHVNTYSTSYEGSATKLNTGLNLLKFQENSQARLPAYGMYHLINTSEPSSPHVSFPYAVGLESLSSVASSSVLTILMFEETKGMITSSTQINLGSSMMVWDSVCSLFENQF